MAARARSYLGMVGKRGLDSELTLSDLNAKIFGLFVEVKAPATVYPLEVSRRILTNEVSSTHDHPRAQSKIGASFVPKVPRILLVQPKDG